MSSTDDKAIVLGVGEKPKLLSWFFLSIQHLFAMFGATVLVPTLTGMSPSIALISSGVGTLSFLLITKGKVPSYLGSSFAFINPVITLKALEGLPYNCLPYGSFLVGGFCVGVIYGVVALLIKAIGVRWLMNLLPPVVVGPVIMVIGLSLASTAVGMITNNSSGQYDLNFVLIGLVTLFACVVTSVFTRGFLSVIPVLIGIVVGYLFSMTLGVVDTSSIERAGWFEVPSFVIPFVHYRPYFTLKMALIMLPVAIVPIAEHIGHQLVLSKVIGKDLIQDPGLGRSLMGDGVATMLASLIGGPANTTYGENIGVLAITRAFSIYIFVGASFFAILFGFCGKISALLSSIPSAVMGGVSILLFGIIASSGLRMLVESHVDFKDKRNLIISSVILVIGIGGATIHIGDSFSLEGMALASVIGVVLNLVLPGRQEVDFESMFND